FLPLLTDVRCHAHGSPGRSHRRWRPVPEVGRVALRTRTGPRITRRPLGVVVLGGPAPRLGMQLAHAEPDAQPVKDATRTCGNRDRGVLLDDLRDLTGAHGAATLTDGQPQSTLTC